ncbi:DNA-processing protein DprA [Eubacterium oxidoreducens]|uniref:DNA processing protein n=1 Tax=Eubacterium oxidoreducens TaxID=1732 RepID=A0A1G6AQG7_EUBOX|nr:DNA-processing protein DprA [Eubacterium oxidoreducens]SDB10615.1 DNA processing protein [Eubacterium oxidoreducens]
MIYEYWLANTGRFTPVQINKLLKVAGSPQEVYRMRKEQIQKICLWSEDVYEEYQREKKSWNLLGRWEEFKKLKMGFLTILQKEYPAVLKEIYDPPYALYYYGNLELLKRQKIAIVGARRCSDYGAKTARVLAHGLAHRGNCIVSGMAEGIDAYAHAGALEGVGKTIAVLGCGVNVCYPAKNRALYKAMKEQGLIISEYGPGVQPVAWHFPMRNRIISGLSEKVIVVEAKEKSGSLITADAALDQGKDVYAVPGRLLDPLSKGCNELIRQGAGIISDADAFLSQYNACVLELGEAINSSLSQDEMKVYQSLDYYPKRIENIIEEAAMDYRQVLVAVSSLIAKGCARESFKNQYIRV